MITSLGLNGGEFPEALSHEDWLDMLENQMIAFGLNEFEEEQLHLRLDHCLGKRPVIRVSDASAPGGAEALGWAVRLKQIVDEMNRFGTQGPQPDQL